MSFLVELNRSAYPDNALDAFAVSAQFSLDNARAMMWLSQLAYETASESKVKSILDAWHLTLRAFKTNDPDTGFPPHSACVVVAGGHGATFVAFAGSDPLKIEDWITDFDAVKSAEDLHTGFQQAVETVWPDLKTVIGNRPASEQALFFTGHSLGGALAILAAARAIGDGAGAAATAVYTFGSPRTGGQTFFDNYTPQLGNSTFRLVDGTDVVPTVPPSLSDDYLHVGRAVQCPTDGLFAENQIMAPDQNKPDIVGDAIQAGLADIRAFAAFRLVRRIGPRLLDRFAALLPRMVRDHVPASYFRALSITLG
jgi:predicted lipase